MKSGAERKFIYAYWPWYDTISHQRGSESAEAAAETGRSEGNVRKLLERELRDGEARSGIKVGGRWIVFLDVFAANYPRQRQRGTA